MKKEKETIVIIKLINIKSIKIVYFKNITAKIEFFGTLYFIIYLII